ncbi:MAG: GNAT family N-acetyltransferase [Actinomycetes bacterium]
MTERLVLCAVSYADGVPTSWRIVDRTSGEDVGSIGFFGRNDAAGGVLVGYEVANVWRGRGLATEALSAVLSYVADTRIAATVLAETEADHVASRRVMEKAGMAVREIDGGRVVYAFDCTRAVASAP